MKYFILKREKETYWFEISEDNYAQRQIILDENGEYHISCREDCLAEGCIEEADLNGEIISLTKQEFESVWKSVLKKNEKSWEMVKQKYPIGARLQGMCSYFYPQGTVITGEDFIAIYKGVEGHRIKEMIKFKITSYDDENMWLIVE